MLEVPHALAGGALGGLTGNPFLAAPVGVASHFAGDLLPHWNPQWPFKGRREYVLAIGDFVVALGLVGAFYVMFPDRPEIAIGAFCGCLPDILSAATFILKVTWFDWLTPFHIRVQNEVSLRAGWWPQGLVALLSIYYLAQLT